MRQSVIYVERKHIQGLSYKSDIKFKMFFN